MRGGKFIMKAFVSWFIECLFQRNYNVTRFFGSKFWPCFSSRSSKRICVLRRGSWNQAQQIFCKIQVPEIRARRYSGMESGRCSPPPKSLFWWKIYSSCWLQTAGFKVYLFWQTDDWLATRWGNESFKKSEHRFNIQATKPKSRRNIYPRVQHTNCRWCHQIRQ